MTITDTPATLIWMPMADILALTSFDAEHELECRKHGFGHPDIALHGTTVADILTWKTIEVFDTYNHVFQPVIESMMAHGQTCPIHVTLGYLFNGHHRVAIAYQLGWLGMWVTDEAELAEDQAFDDAHPRSEDDLAR